ncbi:MAG: serpin family protein, partial [Waddliaceae bacterium]|nr:serpin family protein [Waddliaceae bacterium]
QYYRAHVDTLDFIRNKKYAVATINGWVAENTNDKILDILTEQDVSDSTRLVLVNALYFKGSWQHPFRAENTIEDPFYVSTEVTTMAEMMNQTTKIPYHKGEGYSVVALPYQEESSEIPGYAMVIIVPDDYNGITAVEENLDIETVMNDYASLEPTKVQLSMPKFSMRKKVLLNEVLQQMGMVTPFTGDADFSDINGFGDLSISKVIHETFIDVDEEGTEAAAATAVTMNLTSVYSPEPAVVVRADHPFMAFIVDQATGSILFMGKVVNPKE